MPTSSVPTEGERSAEDKGSVEKRFHTGAGALGSCFNSRCLQGVMASRRDGFKASRYIETQRPSVHDVLNAVSCMTTAALKKPTLLLSF